MTDGRAVYFAAETAGPVDRVACRDRNGCHQTQQGSTITVPLKTGPLPCPGILCMYDAVCAREWAQSRGAVTNLLFNLVPVAAASFSKQEYTLIFIA